MRLENLIEQEKAIAASQVYNLTLWPAFVSIIVAMCPNVAVVGSDSSLRRHRLLTYASMSGFVDLALPHQIVMYGKHEARTSSGVITLRRRESLGEVL